MEALHVYDTTLRDGAQQEGLNLSVSDKLAIAGLLDDLGVDFIEGGWPGRQPEGHRVLRARPGPSWTCATRPSPPWGHPHALCRSAGRGASHRRPSPAAEIVDQAVGMDELHCGGRHRGRRAARRRPRRSRTQQRAQSLAAIEHAVAHGLVQAHCRGVRAADDGHEHALHALLGAAHALGECDAVQHRPGWFPRTRATAVAKSPGCWTRAPGPLPAASAPVPVAAPPATRPGTRVNCTPRSKLRSASSRGRSPASMRATSSSSSASVLSNPESLGFRATVYLGKRNFPTLVRPAVKHG